MHEKDDRWDELHKICARIGMTVPWSLFRITVRLNSLRPLLNLTHFFINGTEINVDIHKLMYKTIQKESTITMLQQ